MGTTAVISSSSTSLNLTLLETYVTVYAEIGRLSTQSITRYGERYILCLIMAKLGFWRQRLL